MPKPDQENTGNTNYLPEMVGQYFDEFGIKEWDRLTDTPADEVSLFIHTHYLNKHISKGDQILEVGAGPGRFTQILAGLGTHITVADISRVQLDLNKRFAHEFGFDQVIVDWHQLDICDMSRFDPGSFDCVVAYGGPFSYVLDKRDLALAECLRVLKPGGMLFLSVMSLWGTAHAYLNGVLSMPVATNQLITNTGNITPETFPERKNNFMHMFRERELSKWLEKRSLIILDKSASNCISLTWNETTMHIRDDAGKWNELLRMELEACAETGCLNMGTHLIVVARKPF
jgi:2-polyprenyl-3-methyl-5-hydroxy-6-metoxy-1,4-benzoquinol methylase